MLKVLMYHYVHDEIEHPMCVYEKEFFKQIQYLKSEGYHFVTLKELHELENNQGKYDKSVMITFDDGYYNTLEKAMPILNKFEAKAVMSICSSYIKAETCPKETIHLNQHFAVVEEIEKLWLANGHEVAAHTYSHPKLTRIDQSEYSLEIMKDKEILESEFGFPFEAFFYPFGSYNDTVECMIRKYYRFAFLTDSGNAFSSENHYRIHRIQVRPEWNIEDFKRKLSME